MIFSTLNLSLSLILRTNMNRASFLQNIAYLAITLKNVVFRRMATETIGSSISSVTATAINNNIIQVTLIAIAYDRILGLHTFCMVPVWSTVKKVKVSHSLIAVGAVGVRVPLYLGHS